MNVCTLAGGGSRLLPSTLVGGEGLGGGVQAAWQADSDGKVPLPSRGSWHCPALQSNDGGGGDGPQVMTMPTLLLCPRHGSGMVVSASPVHVQSVTPVPCPFDWHFNVQPDFPRQHL